MNKMHLWVPTEEECGNRASWPSFKRLKPLTMAKICKTWCIKKYSMYTHIPHTQGYSSTIKKKMKFCYLRQNAWNQQICTIKAARHKKTNPTRSLSHRKADQSRHEGKQWLQRLRMGRTGGGRGKWVNRSQSTVRWNEHILMLHKIRWKLVHGTTSWPPDTALLDRKQVWKTVAH